MFAENKVVLSNSGAKVFMKPLSGDLWKRKQTPRAIAHSFVPLPQNTKACLKTVPKKTEQSWPN